MWRRIRSKTNGCRRYAARKNSPDVDLHGDMPMMAGARAVRRRVAEVARRLSALREESVAPAHAVQILVAERALPPPANADSALPLAAAIESLLPRGATPAGTAQSIAAYVGAAESGGR